MNDTSITGVGGSSQPFSRVQKALQRDVSSGAISATDQTAITAALSDISTQLSAGGGASATAGSATTTTSTAPASMKDRVDSLIDNEVSSGKLTSDQASELKGAFEQAAAHMHGAGGHHVGGGNIAAVLGTDTSSSTDKASATDSTSSTGTTNPLTAAATNAVSALEAFITQFKSAVSSNSVYGANGTSSSTSSSLLINSIG